MSFIGDIIGGVIGAVTSGVIAIYISQKGIKQERKERYVEKLQDRKDMWLNEHYRELSKQFERLSNFKLLDIEDKDDIQILGTNLVVYKIWPNFINVNMKLKLKCITETYKNVVIHLQEGYPDLPNKMMELWEAEDKYKDLLSNSSNDMLNRILELMKNHFPLLSPSLEDIKTNHNLYNIKKMINTLLLSMLAEVNQLEFDEERDIIYSHLYNNDIIAYFTFTEYNEFKSDVWDQVNKEFKKQIDILIENYYSIGKLEIKFRNSMKNIIDDYDAGHSIKGYCDICEKIYHETDITKLRPKI